MKRPGRETRPGRDDHRNALLRPEGAGAQGVENAAETSRDGIDDAIQGGATSVKDNRNHLDPFIAIPRRSTGLTFSVSIRRWRMFHAEAICDADNIKSP
ncbi:hypothetical protein [Nocardia inohanensis]|uniref:hypothetical protein n=1 Tax=Nocardia inohanensis TaxID=209246 RepID=UPI0012F9A0E5|nr:hypothetical protein [Nocardia inohanensis]